MAQSGYDFGFFRMALFDNAISVRFWIAKSVTIHDEKTLLLGKRFVMMRVISLAGRIFLSAEHLRLHHSHLAATPIQGRRRLAVRGSVFAACENHLAHGAKNQL